MRPFNMVLLSIKSVNKVKFNIVSQHMKLVRISWLNFIVILLVSNFINVTFIAFLHTV